MRQQTITLVLADGRRATYVGPVQVDDSHRIIDVVVTPRTGTADIPVTIEMPCGQCGKQAPVDELFVHFGRCGACAFEDHYTGDR